MFGLLLGNPILLQILLVVFVGVLIFLLGFSYSKAKENKRDAKEKIEELEQEKTVLQNARETKNEVEAKTNSDLDDELSRWMRR